MQRDQDRDFYQAYHTAALSGAAMVGKLKRKPQDYLNKAEPAAVGKALTREQMDEIDRKRKLQKEQEQGRKEE